jgi:predicted metal-dependent phosphotriesterase family hydrolase
VATDETVRGPVEVAALGRVLMHGHVTEEQITRMLVDNPRHYLGG